MATLSRPRKPRTVKVPTGSVGLVLRLTIDGETTRYSLAPVPVDDPATFGVLRAFRLRKLGKAPGQALAALYDVVEHLDGGMTCDCTAACHSPEGMACEHILGIRRLQQQGILARGRIR